MITVLLATRNLHKVEEIKTIVGKTCNCVSLKDLAGAPEVVEDAPSFSGNATKKAVTLAKWLAESGAAAKAMAPPAYVLADDSGLEVDALHGAPGVHSARFAAVDGNSPGNSSDAANNEKLLRLLHAVPLEKRTARFRCVLALTPVTLPPKAVASPVCYADEWEFATELFEGSCEGRIEMNPKGKGGFGYDPLFVPLGYDQSFSELGEEIKNQISHRSKALAKLKLWLDKPFISISKSG